MSELICKNSGHANARWRLLTGVSVIGIELSTCASPSAARAEDADRPTVWIELGGQLNRMEAGQEIFAPEIMEDRPSIFAPSQKFEKPPRYGFEEMGAISIEPNHSGLVFSVAVRYGRSKSNKHVQQQTNPEPPLNMEPLELGSLLLPLLRNLPRPMPAIASSMWFSISRSARM